MKYGKVVEGLFERRINRFIAEVFIGGAKEKVHIKNTGRLKEILQPGAEVLLEYSDNLQRKTKFSLIAAKKNGTWINIDSQAPNKVAYESIKEGKISELGKVDLLKREVTYGSSRFDLYFEKEKEKGFIEIKGVTFERDGIAMFPDAPTTRGTKHVLELIKAAKEGYTAGILFVLQMNGCFAFTPHEKMDKEFTNALIQASREGVNIIAYDCIVKTDKLFLNQSVPVKLPGGQVQKLK
ncbi:MAG TPA: DNA/RNA nuclease SfsA [Virgibacillus sp.]|nr:DNA/RNA nuclease SfsA [Virgibacillus sp.]HLR68965.1 DNA/RNA nuclease SfsA [Virgibacillus sp.]